MLHFLGAPWPRYVTTGDVLLNVAAYLPLGALSFIALRPRLSAAVAWVTATLLGAALSLALECTQMFLPTRVASNIDLIANGSGAGIGALIALAFALPALRDSGLVALRRHWLRSDVAGDAALIVVALWIALQLYQAPLPFTSGDVRDIFDLSPWFAYTPNAYLLAEAVSAGLALTGSSMLAAFLVRPGRSVWPVIAIALALAVAVKSVGAMAFSHATQTLQWATPGVLLGSAGALVLLELALRLPRAPRAAAAILCVAGSAVLVNATPENPYQSAPLFLLGAQTTHLVNFSHIARAASQLWPLLALCALAALAVWREPPGTP